ncbi:DUF6236 family protein [Vibrio brasiliensis]|uniref:DUF6236 family protein n=1 Tax=Vibrio brasiliensis TaxID=170652 RepID=UPI001EFD3A45|nr:DUF6236 family protein [Vibrio brasiliensis]MCG9727511.1 DUF6236 family protein [Vibrio brasiliensis]
MDKQGVLAIAPSVERIQQGTNVRFGINWTLDEMMLRYFVLYWDKINLVSAAPFSQGLSGESALLKEAGILETTTGYNRHCKDLSDSLSAEEALPLLFDQHIPTGYYIHAVSKEINKLLKDKYCDWTIHNRLKGLSLPSQNFTELTTAKVELNGCLPVPISQAPLQEILDFKMNRSAEFSALRSHLDELYYEISKSGDIDFSTKMEVQRLRKSIVDLNKVSRERFGICSLVDRQVSIELNLGSISAGLTTGATLSTFSCAVHPIYGIGVGLAAGLLSSIKVSANISRELTASIGNSKLSYLSAIHGKGWL